ncbi:MAG: hypothetical protein KDJ16_06150 [Hyphomicrobiales bacterium]|nr:hypothetical protein [Hyphomicrobiales bacterium]
MTMPGVFLGGAGGRLLPASVPFRFFLSASCFHVALWLAVGLGADEIVGFVGGPGPALAALHLLTLGVLAMTAMGAAFQLLPVATRKPIPSVRTAKTAFYLYLPGVVVLTAAMGTVHLTGILIGATLTTLGLIAFAGVVAGNLLRGRDLALVAAHGWVALLALLAAVVFGLMLAGDYRHGFLGDHSAMGLAHGIAAVFGFMGLLAFGFSYVLIPMLSLSRVAAGRRGQGALAAAAIATALAIAGLFVGRTEIVAAGFIAALIAAALHLSVMTAAMKARMRRRLGISFVMIRVAWAMLALGLLLATAIVLGAPIQNGATLAGFVLAFGWLLTLLLGVLQRIMPFLASMHAAKGPGKPVKVSEIAGERPLTITAYGHFTALAFIAVGILTDFAWTVRLGAVAGAIGAIAFLVFAVGVVRHLKTVGAE